MEDCLSQSIVSRSIEAKERNRCFLFESSIHRLQSELSFSNGSKLLIQSSSHCSTCLIQSNMHVGSAENVHIRIMYDCQKKIVDCFFFFFDNRTMIYVLLEEYTMKKHMTLYNILPSCCFPSLPFSFSIDIRNMFGGSERVREREYC